MTVQEAVERCIGFQDDSMPLVFNIYDETPGTVPGLLYGNCDMDSLVVHMFDLDVFNYDVVEIKSKVKRYHFNPEGTFNPEVGIYQMVVDISVKNCTKERCFRNEQSDNPCNCRRP